MVLYTNFAVQRNKCFQINHRFHLITFVFWSILTNFLWARFKIQDFFSLKFELKTSPFLPLYCKVGTPSEKISTHLMLVEDLIHQPKWWLIICGQKSTFPCKLGWANVSQFAKGQKISKKKYVVLDSSKKRTLGQFYVLKNAPAFVFWKNPGRHNLLLRFTDL